MTTIDTTPQWVDIKHLVGDTLTIEVTAPASITDGKVWEAQIRSTRDAAVVDASFTITPPAVSGGPAYLELSAATTRALASLGTFLREMKGTRAVSIQRYTGEFDVQLSVAGSDPVTTLVQGSLTLDLDVTRD